MKGVLNLLFLLCSTVVLAVHRCPSKQGGGICPDGNTSCPLKNGGSGCIPSDMGSFNGTCCSDGATGCAVNYTCGANRSCHATADAKQDPLLQVMPRYTLCHAFHQTLSKVHGLPVVKDAKLAYYSSHGNILYDRMGQIELALVIIHGAGRNADDYFCSASAAVELQKEYPKRSVLVIALHFPSLSDELPELTEGGVTLQWASEGDGPWRYGANAVYPSYASAVSSFGTFDLLMTALGNTTRFANLKHIVIAGHSSGGQFVQRWSLLTSTWALDKMSSVVANPSNYAYLTPLRFVNHTYQKPPKRYCPQYNEWEYGLEDGGDMPVSYKDKAWKAIGYNLTALKERFASRHVAYLAGGADRCNVSELKRDGWCFSHGLETTCMDMLQGRNRLERNTRYVNSLRREGIATHERRVVQGVGHDHSLIFTSPVGLEVLFPKAGGQTDDAIA